MYNMVSSVSVLARGRAKPITDSPSAPVQIFSVISFLLFWTLGAVVFWAVDDLPYGESLYFCFVFFLTIGYAHRFSLPLTVD